MLLGVSAASFVPGSAQAQESAETEALLKKGIQLRRDGADEQALQVFLQAEAGDPNSVRVLLHVATAAQAASKWLLADEYLRKASERSEDPYYQRYRAEIEEVRTATAQRVGQVRVVGAPSGADVSLNGQAVGTLPMENPKSIEAGTYVLEVTKPGFYRLRRPISVPGGVLTRETVQLNERPANAPDSPDGAGAGAVGADAGVRPLEWWQSSWVTWTLLGVGVAGGAVSGGAFFVREQAADKWNDDERCLDPQRALLTRDALCGGDHDDAELAEQVGITAGIVGAVFTTAALTHWLTTPSAREAPPQAGQVNCSPGMMSLVCNGSF